MKTYLTFEMDSESVDVNGCSTNQEDDQYFKDLINVDNFKFALWDIQQALREIVKYKLTNENAVELINEFYRDTLPEILRTRNINLSDN